MRYSNFLVAAAISAAYAHDYSHGDCQDDFKACIAKGTPEVVCSCALGRCLGEDNARDREYCASATKGLVPPTPAPPAPGPPGPPEPVPGPPAPAPAPAPGPPAPGPPAPPTYACNPAHQYPNGEVCVSTSGTLALVKPTAPPAPGPPGPPAPVPGPPTPAPGPPAPAPGPAPPCNPNTYGSPDCPAPPAPPAPGPPAPVPPPPVTPTPPMPQPTYACNPAHKYPEGQICATVSGTLSLVTTTGTHPYTFPTATGTGGLVPTGGNKTTTKPTSGITPSTGDASLMGVTLSGVIAVVAGVVAWAL